MKDQHRNEWNERQKALRLALKAPKDQPQAVALFLQQHAMLHAAEVSGSGLWSFEDELFAGLPVEVMRLCRKEDGHSIAWNLWHLARIEDITMNLLLAGKPQLFESDGWEKQLAVTWRDTGNAMDAQTIHRFSQEINLPALRMYRQEVGRNTRQVVQAVAVGGFKQPVDPLRLQMAQAQGAVDPGAGWLIAYWGGLTLAGLLLMPPTRHNFVHLNEALRLKQLGRAKRLLSA